MNWRNFWRFWGFRLDRYLLIVCTPWIAIHLSSGSMDFPSRTIWRGLRVYWGHPKNWNLDEGREMFSKRDFFLSSNTSFYRWFTSTEPR